MAERVRRNWRWISIAATIALLFSFLVTASQADETAEDTLTIAANDPDGSTTNIELIGGSTYRLIASGTYTYGPGRANHADAECSRNALTDQDPTWQPDRFGPLSEDPNDDPLDLYVDDRPIVWQTTIATQQLCDQKTHTYQATLTPATTKRINLRIYDPFWQPDNIGSLVVKVFEGGEPVQREGDVLIGSVVVDSQDADGIEFPTIPGQEYRLVASGTYSYWLGVGMTGDAECSRTSTDPAWIRNRFTLGVNDSVDLYVNNGNVDWTALVDAGGGCNLEQPAPAPSPLDHTYRYMFVATKTALNLRLNTPWMPYASGSLLVRIFIIPRASSPSAPNPDDLDLPDVNSPVPLPSLVPSKGIPLMTFQVSAADLYGVNITLEAAKNFVIEVSGAYAYSFSEFTLADVECSRGNVSSADPSWLPHRYNAVNNNDPSGDPLDLIVGGTFVNWLPVDPRNGVCDEKDHLYQTTITTPNHGPTQIQVNFRIYDPFWAYDNVDITGGLQVKIFPGPVDLLRPSDIPMGVAVVQAAQTQGTDLTLVGGQTYRLLSFGSFVGPLQGDPINTYKYGQTPGAVGDVECSTHPSDLVWRRDRFGPQTPDPNDDPSDLYFDGGNVNWIPMQDTGGGCNTNDHVYVYEFFLASTRTINLRIADSWMPDNSGVLLIEVFLVRTQPIEVIGVDP